MITIKLLKEYLGHKVGDVILVDNNIAFGLVDSGTATTNLKVKVVSDDEKKTTVMTPQTRKKGRGYKIK